MKKLNTIANKILNANKKLKKPNNKADKAKKLDLNTMNS